MTNKCGKCGNETDWATYGPLTNYVTMCGLCFHEATGEGAVVDCVECRQRQYVGNDGDLVTARLCRSCYFWAKRLAEADDPCTVRIDGEQYRIVPDGEGPLGGLFQGFGGREFGIEFFDGRRVTTRNLWTQGVIPEHFRSRLPDNARFIDPRISATKDENPRKLPVRPVAAGFYECLLAGREPTVPARFDFGIDSDRHYLALQYAVREHGVTPEMLDEALGDGAALTALIRPDNPFYGVQFRTPWEDVMVSIKEWADPGIGGRISLGWLRADPQVFPVIPREEINQALKRHAAGDWGDVDENWRAMNDAASYHEGEVISVYQSQDGMWFEIWTDPEHRMTVVKPGERGI